ncbi:MAG: hypothetical protein OEX83_05750 [Gammaproteobacteria bacterium]|nr:hypothetical protein [Gammaproteobacteria bacterium]
MHDSNDMLGWFGFGHWGFGLLFWVVIIALVVVLIKRLTSNNNTDK